MNRLRPQVDPVRAGEKGLFLEIMAVLAAALTFAYIGRFWLGLFTGARHTDAHAIPALLVAPVVVLAAAALFGGFVVGPFAGLAGVGMSAVDDEAADIARHCGHDLTLAMVGGV